MIHKKLDKMGPWPDTTGLIICYLGGLVITGRDPMRARTENLYPHACKTDSSSPPPKKKNLVDVAQGEKL